MSRTRVLVGIGFLAVFGVGALTGWLLATWRRPAGPSPEGAGGARPAAAPVAELSPGFVATLPPRWRERYPAIYAAGMRDLGLPPEVIRDKGPHDLAAHANEERPGLGFLRPSFVTGQLERELIDRLPRHWGALNSAYRLTGLVANGGLHGFFSNTRGALNTRLLDDLALLGAAEHRAVVAEALGLYAEHGAGSPEVYAALDERWHRLPSLLAVAGEFIKPGPALFLLQVQG